MGLVAALQGNRIYLDVNIWIYALEGYSAFAQELALLFQNIDQGLLTAVTSELSLAEALVKPVQDQDITLQEIYKQAISTRSHFLVTPIGRDILIRAAYLRAVTGLKLPDSIHLATALQYQCTTFLSNDQRFQAISGIHTVILSKVIFP
jgi:predicted nucleic acid-binding protein